MKKQKLTRCCNIREKVKSIHIICGVTDNGEHKIRGYRRKIIINKYVFTRLYLVPTIVGRDVDDGQQHYRRWSAELPTIVSNEIYNIEFQ